MLTTKKDGEISHYFHFDLDLNNFFSSFTTKEEDYNYDELNNALEEKIFYISPIKNKLKKKKLILTRKKLIIKTKKQTIINLQMKFKIIILVIKKAIIINLKL